MNSGFLELETDRLVLRSMTQDDFDFIFHHFSDPAVSRFLVDEEPVRTRAQAQEIVDFYADTSGKTYNRWVIELKSEKRPVGTCGYHLWHKGW